MSLNKCLIDSAKQIEELRTDKRILMRESKKSLKSDYSRDHSPKSISVYNQRYPVQKKSKSKKRRKWGKRKSCNNIR